MRSVVIKEMSPEDDLVAAAAADKLDESLRGNYRAQINEQIRHCLVEVDGVRVNIGGVPYRAMNGWNRKTMHLVTAAFLELNSTDDKVTEDFLKSGVSVGEVEIAKPDASATAAVSAFTPSAGFASAGI